MTLGQGLEPADRPGHAPRTARGRGSPAHPFRPDIEGLRAVAVLLVVIYHAGVPVVPGGYVGVDVFFVISGFLITGRLIRGVQETGRVSFLAFYAGRIRRLLPAATVVVVLTVVAVRLLESYGRFRSIGWDAIVVAVSGMNYRLAIGGLDYQQPASAKSPLQHFWSLAVEEQFYLLWPLLIAICVVAGGRHLRRLLCLALVLGCALSLSLSVVLTASNGPLAFYSLPTRAWELGVGALLALTVDRIARLPESVTAPLSWLGLAAIVWSGLVYTDATPFPGSAALVPVLGTAAVVAAGCNPSRRGAGTVLGLRPMQHIGAVSYSWYLWHWPLIILVPLIVGRASTWPEALGLGALGFVLAVLTFRFVEAPTRRSRLTDPAWMGMGVALTTAIVAAGAVLVTVSAPVGSGAPATPPTVAAGSDADADGDGIADSGEDLVIRAVSDGTSTTAVPSNLRPSLDAVSEDRPRTTRTGCHVDFFTVDNEPCVFGDPDGRRTMVLFGDSHAQQWFPALDVAARENQWRLISWTKSACPVADVVPYSDKLERSYPECVTWRERTVEQIVDLRPDLVVVSQSDRPDQAPDEHLTDLAWAETTTATLRRLQAAGPVTYLLDTPYPGFEVADCVAEHLEDVRPCAAGRAEAAADAGRRELLAATLAAAGVATIEPIDWFCTATECPPIVGGLLVYRDTDHMTATYSAWLAPMLAPLFSAPSDR